MSHAQRPERPRTPPQRPCLERSAGASACAASRPVKQARRAHAPWRETTSPTRAEPPPSSNTETSRPSAGVSPASPADAEKGAYACPSTRARARQSHPLPPVARTPPRPTKARRVRERCKQDVDQFYWCMPQPVTVSLRDRNALRARKRAFQFTASRVSPHMSTPRKPSTA